MELHERLVEIRKAGADLLESTTLLEGLNDGHDSSKVSTAESDNKTVDHDDRVLRHLVVHSLALEITSNDVGPCNNKALVDCISNRSKSMHCILHTLRHVLRGAPQEAAHKRLLSRITLSSLRLLGLLLLRHFSLRHFLRFLRLSLSQNLLVFTAHLYAKRHLFIQNSQAKERIKKTWNNLIA